MLAGVIVSARGVSPFIKVVQPVTSTTYMVFVAEQSVVLPRFAVTVITVEPPATVVKTPAFVMVAVASVPDCQV